MSKCLNDNLHDHTTSDEQLISEKVDIMVSNGKFGKFWKCTSRQ